MTGAGTVIVGGGISGLAAANRLRALLPDGSITLIERDSRLGGKIVTEHVDGFVIEQGPDSFIAAKPRGLGLCQELGLTDQLRGTRQETRGSFVVHAGRLYPLPEGLSGLIPTRLGPIARTGLLSPRGKARVGLDFVLPARPGDDDESLAAFIERRLGRQVYERLVEPLMTGIYGGDGTKLSLAATFPQLRQAERGHGGLIKGLLATRKAAASPSKDGSPRPGFLAPVAGMGELTAALERQLRTAHVCLRANTTATGVSARLDAVGGRYDVQLEEAETLPADAVILATPAFVTADLIADLDPAAAELLRQIPYTSVAIVTLAYDHADLGRDLRGHGYVVPRIEQRSTLACTWTSSKWANRAPDGGVLLRVFLGRGRLDVAAATDAELLGLAADELRMTLEVTAKPTLSRVVRWPRAMPQYTLGHLDRLARLDERIAAHPGLRLAGAGYRGVGIPDCIASGELAAAAVLAVS